MTVYQWNDSNSGLITSNFENSILMETTSRFCWKQRKRINIKQPHMISNYNKYMGGVDLLDQFLSTYRTQLQSKKWWWNIFSNFLNLTVVAAWRIHPVLVDY